jgi:hypothetical protein
MKNLIVTSLLSIWLGTVDQVHKNVALVEITSSKGDSFQVELSTFIFPCEISEGDVFYFEYIDGVTEIRCGNPPQ